MKKLSVSFSILLIMILGLTGCNPVGAKSTSLSIIYGAAAVISCLLLVGYCRFVRSKNGWFLLLFSSVLVVNTGYLFLAISRTLNQALWANRIAYLGSVLLPLAMLMIIFNVTNTKYARPLPVMLGGLSTIIFFIAASPGYLDIYYKEVSFEIIDGAASLVKVYGPLHSIYLLYLLGYFGAIIAVIIHAQVRKTIDTTAHAVVIAIAVFVNIGVWFIEQITNITFEFLSISYIISELFLLGVHLVMNENQRLKDIVKQKEAAEIAQLHIDAAAVNTQTSEEIVKEAIDQFQAGLNTLTAKERELFDAYTSGKSTKDILALMNISENTLKYHNKNLYSKLGVSSRKQLIAIYNRICLTDENIQSNKVT